jgi:hypothetical protein
MAWRLKLGSPLWRKTTRGAAHERFGTQSATVRRRTLVVLILGVTRLVWRSLWQNDPGRGSDYSHRTRGVSERQLLCQEDFLIVAQGLAQSTRRRVDIA